MDLTLVPSVSSVAPSSEFTVGLTIRHQPGFHTYWKNPGAVGYPIQLKWDLPEGFTAGPLRWPVPEISSMAGHRVFGYKRDVTLLVDITAPAVLPAGDMVFHADVAWMACSNACYPDQRRFSITIPSGETSVERLEAKELFAKAEEEIPQPLEGWKVELKSAADAAKIVVRFTPPQEMKDSGELKVFSSDGQVSSDPVPVITQEDGAYLVAAERAEFSPKGKRTLPVVLVGDGWFGTLEPEYGE